jgi:hypothetical protein
MWPEWLARMMRDRGPADLGPAALPLRGAADPPEPSDGDARQEAERPLFDLAAGSAAG